MSRLGLAAVVLAFVGLTGIARADDKPNPTGTWKWKVEINGQEREFTLKLKLDGDKLTGAMIGRDGNETAIQDAKYKNGEVSFKVERERNGQKFTTKYSGKISGDTLKAKSETEINGEVRTREFEAKREKS
ncbi:MAG TPA: hypothetical protein VKE94_22045 [Gemmataceae bacterium]|nr:hypothetical protein [Gemmataceae bacterium]